MTYQEGSREEYEAHLASISDAEWKRRTQDAVWFSKDPPRLGPDPPLTFHKNFTAIQPKRYVVGDFLAEGEVSCFFGEPGATKGTIAVDIACHVAAGLPWMGRTAGGHLDPWERKALGKESMPAGVLYIALERSTQVQRRVEAFTDEHGIQEPLDLAIWSGPLDLVGSERDDILSAVYAHERAQEEDEEGEGSYREVRLVVIDTLARAFGSGSDSGGEETAAVARKFERVLRFRPDLHILVVHHTPIGDDSRLRGHGNLLAAFDQTVRVRKHKVGSTATVMKDNDTAEEGKARFAYALKSRVIHVAKDGKETTAPVVVPLPAEAVKHAMPKVSVKAAGPKASKSEQPLLDALEGLGGSATEADWRVAFDAARQDGLSPSAHRKRWSVGRPALEAKGLVQKDSEGRYRVTVTNVTE
ncbi:AAA family ATPase [Shinella sp. DD12]|uniref:AAA family ATPase n=1 Tax=Shinella sp. DD12 TaxID=1410620 RepID=UPI00043796D7|nr:AAA family ATPase [Shinella sp. DD12]EYR81854.1 AAA domain containing protein [Shinella sp. DD12]